ncbi:hypothetical protein [Clostridium akagii]|nr:hypothetical protein [Clostridium akagii]
MGKKKTRELKVVIINPEAIEGARKKATEIAVELYMKAIRDGRIKPIN